MNKKFLIISALFCGMSLHSMTQWSFGLKAGIGYNKVSNPLSNSFDFDANHQWGLMAGAMAAYQLNQQFDIQGELYYAHRGFTTDIYVDMNTDKAHDWNFNLHYLCLPILVKYHPFGSIVYVEAGPQVSLLVDSNNDVADYEEDVKFDTNTNKVDFGLVGGIGADLTSHVTADLRYYHGLTKTWKGFNWKGFDGGKNRSIELSVGYWF